MKRFQSDLAVYFDGKDDDLARLPVHPSLDRSPARQVVAETKAIELRDYQRAATEQCLRDLDEVRSSLIVLATGLGKTILFCKIAQGWKGRILVLAHLEELLQNARDDLMAITGEAVGIERAADKHEGERIVVGLIQSVSRRLKAFKPNHFSLIIVDEAHRGATEAYRKVFEHFPKAKIIGLTATDSRSDAKALPFERLAYRMGIKEGIDQGYLVPIRGKHVTLKSINLSRVKRKGANEDGEFDETALDDAMVEGAAAIADSIQKDHPNEKGILFFPGCRSAQLTSEILNERMPGSSVYIDGTITGPERRELVGRLRRGEAKWLCNVGIACEGFNWPDATVVGMATPTFSRLAYIQRVGRGTRPLAGLLNGLSTTGARKDAIAGSAKPSMLILDFVGVSASLGLVSHETFLDETPRHRPEEEVDDGESFSDEVLDTLSGDFMEPEEEDEESFGESNINLKHLAKNLASQSTHIYDEFDPFAPTGKPVTGAVKLKRSLLGLDPPMSHKQHRVLSNNGISDETLTKSEAQKLVGFCAQNGFKLTGAKLGVLHKIYRELKAARIKVDDEEGFS